MIHNGSFQNNQDDSAMNFSFSEIKSNNADKSTLFEKNMQILHTEYPVQYEMLEQISQEDAGEMEYELGCKIKDRKGQYIETGSENAPDDSAYLSGDDDYEQRIVNESDLQEEYQDEYLLDSARSDSICDEDEVLGLARCRAINSSYINLKDNNLLAADGN